VFHLPTPELVLSTRPENYIGDLEEWDRAEAALKQSLDASGQLWTLNEGDGAFYGPKIDIMIEDSDRKKHQTATIQLDFQLPRRFGLEYLAPAPMSEQRGIISEDPVELSESGYVTPVIIHRAVMGSLERFMALLIEHYDGKWPFWLSPRQAIVIPVAITDEIAEYAQAVQETISGVIRRDTTADGSERDHPQPMGRRTFHVDIDMSTNSLSKKIRAEYESEDSQRRHRGSSQVHHIGKRSSDTDAKVNRDDAYRGVQPFCGPRRSICVIYLVRWFVRQIMPWSELWDGWQHR
jgi:threonyl-tRNA synthetase